MSPLPIVLASGSLRRVQLLSRLQVPFTVAVSGVGEEVEDDTDPASMVIHLAERKARAVADQLPRGIVIGADTIVVIDGAVLNKPVNDLDARRMLEMLRGRAHHVWTGVVVVDARTGLHLAKAVRSAVRMRRYRDDEVAAYIATGEPMDKAGAYAIQGGAGMFVEGIDGCYANVVGLPLCELTGLLQLMGVTINLHRPVCELANGDPCPRLD